MRKSGTHPKNGSPRNRRVTLRRIAVIDPLERTCACPACSLAGGPRAAYWLRKAQAFAGSKRLLEDCEPLCLRVAGLLARECDCAGCTELGPETSRYYRLIIAIDRRLAAFDGRVYDGDECPNAVDTVQSLAMVEKILTETRVVDEVVENVLLILDNAGLLDKLLGDE
ncbi:hypothetical protein [Amycolatopsis sp. NPDC059657]|uniref:hypothetical protein n=1 Tax=Amycolatopsis sp. NPDC059657 TaxID=3346899 RepID=UPI00366B1470